MRQRLPLFMGGLGLTVVGQSVFYVLGLYLRTLAHGLAYPVVVGWVVATAVTMLFGTAMLLIRPSRRAGAGVLTGSLLALVAELAACALLVVIWLHSHPGWDLS